MSFFLLKHLTSIDIIQKKQRISLVVNYSIQTSLIFFLNARYMHYDRQSKSVIKQGVLPFVPSACLQSTVKGRVVILGLDEAKSFHVACMSVEQDYLTEIRELSNIKPECTTKHYLFEPRSKENQTFYIIRILKNIQNGIAVEVFDFYRNIWQEQMLYLNSKFLQHLFVDTSRNDQVYKQIGDLFSHTFALISQGQRFDSVNYSKMKVCHENSEEGMKLKLKFIITRELKIKQHFVIVGCMYLGENRLMLAGNSRVEGMGPNQNNHCSTYFIINTHQIQIDQPQNLTVLKTFSPTQAEGELMLRSFIGLVEQNMLFLVKLGDKRFGIAKLNQKACELLLNIQMKSVPSLTLSSLKDSIYSYSSKLQNFFQKIKAEPSILEFDLFRIENKEKQYKKLIKEGFPKLSQSLTDMILYLL